MTPSLQTAALACAVLIATRPAPAAAHAIAGVRVFPVTLTLDDPGVADEAAGRLEDGQQGEIAEHLVFQRPQRHVDRRP